MRSEDLGLLADGNEMAAEKAKAKADAAAKAKAAADAKAKAAADAKAKAASGEVSDEDVVRASMEGIPEESRSKVLSGCDWRQMSWTQRLKRLEDLGLSVGAKAVAAARAKAKAEAAAKAKAAADAKARAKAMAAAAEVARPALMKALGSNTSEESLLAMITPEACHPDEYGEPVVLSSAYDAPLAVVAKIIEVTVETYGRGRLTVGGSGTPIVSPLHHFAQSCESEASLALLIAANPRALKCTDFEGDPAHYGAMDNSNKEIYRMLRSAETADGLARIERLADEVRADLGQAEAAVARYRAGVQKAEAEKAEPPPPPLPRNRFDGLSIE